MPVLPRPGLWTAGRPAPVSVWARISPSTYDSVNRFEPTTNAVFSAAATLPPKSSAKASAMQTPAARRKSPTRRWALLGLSGPRPWPTLGASVLLKRAHSLHPPAAAAIPLAGSAVAQPSPAPARLGRPPGFIPDESGIAQREGVAMTQLKAFIVEDSPVIRENLVAALEEMAPIDVVGTAEDEASAVSWLATSQNRCDLVVVDIFLKSGSGLGVLKAASTGSVAAKLVVLSK